MLQGRDIIRMYPHDWDDEEMWLPRSVFLTDSGCWAALGRRQRVQLVEITPEAMPVSGNTDSLDARN
jgi:hypothetical protein